MNIDIESPMRQAARTGAYPFQPVFQGQQLEVEDRSPETSLRNLRVLLKAGLSVSELIVVENGFVLVTFKSGETYLATGFRVGYEPESNEGRAVTCFAQFASEAFAGSKHDWESHLGYFLKPDQPGRIDPLKTPGLRPKVFRVD